MQADRFIDHPGPSKEELGRLEKLVLERYPHVPPYACVQTGCVERRHVERVWKNVVPDSSPGLPFAELAQFNRDVWEKFREPLVDSVLERMALLARTPVLPSDPVELVKQGFCDPVRVFVKNEGHTVEKIETGRLRLIFSVSLIDQLVERLLFTPQDEEEIDNWRTVPSKPGFGLGNESQIQEFLSLMRDKIPRRAESDVIGWDWNVKLWMMEFEAHLRILLSHEAQDSYFARLTRARFHCLARSIFCLSDGRLFAQTKPCILKSGSKITSSSGSRMRSVFCWWVGASTCDSQGDDCNEDYVEGAMERYAERGLPLKMYNKCMPEGAEFGFEFCSHKFNSVGGYNVRIAKGTHHLLSGAMDNEQLRAWYGMFARHPEFPRYRDVVERARAVPIGREVGTGQNVAEN